VGIRPKIFAAFFTLGILPMLLLSVLNYLNGVRAVEAQLRGEVQRDALRIASSLQNNLRQREESLSALARSPRLREYLRGGAAQEGAPAVTGDNRQPPNGSPSSQIAPSLDRAAPAADNVPREIHAELESLLLANQKYYAAVTCLNARRQPVFRAEPVKGAGDVPAVRFQTQDFLPSTLLADEQVWTATRQTLLRSGVTREAFGPALRYTIPLFNEQDESAAVQGALLVDLKMDAFFSEAAGESGGQLPANPSRGPDGPSVPRLAIMLDDAGEVVYHTNVAHKYQPVASAMSPSFGPIADAMRGRRNGSEFYYSPEGDRWLAAYVPVAPLNLSVAVAGDYAAAVSGLKWWGWMSIGLSAVVGLIAAVWLTLMLGRTARSIEQVTQGAVAIARGKLDQRIEVRSSDEIRLLADTFNDMKDRLREQIAREAESRQFESFMRLSAMLTHDLKNAIAALSLIVSNMERQFHREEFRADAMESLTEATDKLRALVSKLSEPVRSLSGEFKRPRPTDIVPVIRRAVSSTAQPSVSFHEVEMRLPQSVIAVVDPERIEKVVENLALNALEAMGAQKGKLTVAAGQAGEREVFFSISDTGPGMTEEFQRTRLFRAFATTKKKGVGLGLYTCREVVRAQNGRIEVESQRGSGTTFRVVLPSGQIMGSD
jgi:signal transduction histidine kinase